MTPGSRALGVAVSASDRDTPPERATVAGAVVRADRVVDGLSFSTCTVGGTDATAAVIDCWERLDREDVRHLLIAGVAPAWFNVVDLAAVHEATDRPVSAVSFEASDGLERPLREQFDGAALDRRLATYRSLPARTAIGLGDTGADTEAGADTGDDTGEDADTGATLWIRSVGIDEEAAGRLVSAYTPDGRRRPEPLRVAKLAARAGRSYLDDPEPPTDPGDHGSPSGDRVGDAGDG